VHAFLRHLADAGFDGAPRVVGMDDEGREVLTFIEGDVLAAGSTWRPGQPTPWPPWARTDECLAATARLLESFHDAASTFVPPDGAIWRQYHAPVLGHDEIVCNGDIGPHNTVYRNGLPVGFIDWDGVRPNHPLVEFGAAVWKYVPLGNDAYFEASDFPEAPSLAHRVAAFARAYGIHDRDGVRWALQQACQRSLEPARYWPITPAEGAVAFRFVAAELEWLDEVIDGLVADLD
jgi:Ser/Thr protein kinase RdoA (MazF antagonist)